MANRKMTEALEKQNPVSNERLNCHRLNMRPAKSSDTRGCPCVGVVVKYNDKILMLDRRKGVLGWACPAGHRNVGEFPLDCVARELHEETDIQAKGKSMPYLLGADINNECGRGAKLHTWFVYELEVDSPRVVLKEPDKHKGIGWFSPKELEAMNLEPVWRLILKHLKIIKK